MDEIGMMEGFCTLKSSGKERPFQESMREFRIQQKTIISDF